MKNENEILGELEQISVGVINQFLEKIRTPVEGELPRPVMADDHLMQWLTNEKVRIYELLWILHD